MQSEVQKTEEEMKLEQEKKEWNKFKSDLLVIHKQLAPKAELFKALEERGITSVDQLEEKFATQVKENEPKKEEDLKMPSTGNNEEIEAMKKQPAEQQKTIQQQGLQMQTSRLMSDIKEEIKDKPEFALLSKALDENIAYNILRSKEADKEKGITKPLSEYLKGTETQLKGFFTKLGGKMEESKEGEQKAEEPTANPTGSSDSPIDFPSLPASGGDETDSKNDQQANFIKKATDPVTGKFDERTAFENDLKEFQF